MKHRRNKRRKSRQEARSKGERQEFLEAHSSLKENTETIKEGRTNRKQVTRKRGRRRDSRSTSRLKETTEGI